MKLFQRLSPTEQVNQERRDRMHFRRISLAFAYALTAVTMAAMLLAMTRTDNLLGQVGLPGQILAAAIVGALLFDSIRNLKNAVVEFFKSGQRLQTDALWLPDKRHAWKGEVSEGKVKTVSMFVITTLMFAMMFGCIPAVLFAPVEALEAKSLAELHKEMRGLYPIIILFAGFGALVGIMVAYFLRPDRENQI